MQTQEEKDQEGVELSCLCDSKCIELSRLSADRILELERENVRQNIKEFRKEFLTDKKNTYILNAKLRELGDARKVCNRKLDEMFKQMTAAPEKKFWFYRDVLIPGFQEELAKIDKSIRKFELFKNFGRVGQMPEQIDIATLKQIPIGSLMPTLPKRDMSTRATYLCPFHNEKTGSFVWYKKDNRAHCFGCQWDGDVIDLFMKLNNKTFKEALNLLS